MTNQALRFKQHDFGEVLKNLREFMSNQDSISDYDLNQSVVDIILSAMGYNTQNNAITANALFSEMNIGAANNRKNLSMRAKEYGYLPYSIVSSKTLVDLTIIPTSVSEAPPALILDKGTQFTGRVEDDSLIFTVVRSRSAKLVDGVYRFDRVELYQGTYNSVDIVIDKNKRSQVYEIKADDIDLNFLEVYVQESPDSEDFTEFKSTDTSINVTGKDKVYFLQEVNEGRYGIEFGDGIIGSAVQDGVIVRVVYFKTSGEAGNGVKTFKFKASPDSENKINRYSVNILTVEKSTGGLAAESNESVRRNAPRFYVSQNRGNNPSDYSNLIKTRFPYINSISVWSGKEGKGYYDQFGRIYIAANTEKSQFLTEDQKRDIVNTIIDEIGIAGVIPIIVDIDNIYIEINTRVFVNDYVFLRSSDLVKRIKKYAEKFNDEKLNRFKAKFEFSKFSTGIDEMEDSIESNITTIKIQKRVFPDVRVFTNFQTSFMNPVKNVVSNNFTYSNKTVFMKSSPAGTMDIYEIIDGNEILLKSGAGSIDFDTGDLIVNNIFINRLNSQTKDIRFTAEPSIYNVRSLRNNVVTISEIEVSVEETEVS